jgi:hypothetical protein
MSESLQGVRTATTSENGDYSVPLLPPGDYTVSFEIGDFQTVREVRSVAGTQRVLLDASMSIAPVTETVTVVGQAEPFVKTAQAATNFKQDLMATLASNRTLDAIVLMAPSVHATGPRGAFSISGAQSYENLYTLNGAVITENLRGSPFTLYIEDAIQEATVSTAGVSAEYGRFEGGLVAAITKSGGNTFSGSFRTSFANDSWRTYTPFEITQRAANPSLQTKADRIVPTYEATLGGPIAKERLWFFGATRVQNQESNRTTVGTNIPYLRANDEKRYEGKLTYAVRAAHSLQVSYLRIDQVMRNGTSQNVMDLASLTNQGEPQDLLAVHYSAVLTPNLSIEGQYSARHRKLTDVGANTRDLIKGTLVFDNSRNARYWSPTFCSGSTCDGDEERNNDDLVVKGSYFLSNRASGAHNLVFGYDRYNDKILANIHVSGSDYRIRGTSAIMRGGGVYPQFLPNSTIIEHNPFKVLSKGSNLRTHSLFFNDSWRWHSRLSFGLGLRWDKNDAVDGGGQVVGNKGAWAPRLSAIWDPSGQGRWAISGSYARYVMALTSNVAASTTAAGNPSAFRWLYQGPAINADSTAATLVSTDVALDQLFSWFTANGGSTRPPILANVPGVNFKIPQPLESPYANEYAGGVSRQIGGSGTVRVDAIFREYRNFYSMRTDLSTGSVTDQFGRYDLAFVENTNAVRRRYAGLTTQATYNLGRLDLGGNYTLSRAYGNLDGETANAGPSGASIESYPQYKNPSWNSPEGDLAIDQRHRARVWATYAAPIPSRAGALVIGVLEQMASGAPYGAVGPINPTPFVTNPGYVTPPASGTVEYYFTDRDAFHTDATYRTDLSVNYAYTIRAAGATEPELFFHGEVLNLFNQFQLCGCGASVFNNGGATDLTNTIGTTVRTPLTAPTVFQAFNPFTATPARGANWDYAPTFGTALNAFAYTSPRTFRFSVGVRF